jgi:hypothetical protein
VYIDGGELNVWNGKGSGKVNDDDGVGDITRTKRMCFLSDFSHQHERAIHTDVGKFNTRSQ